MASKKHHFLFISQSLVPHTPDTMADKQMRARPPPATERLLDHLRRTTMEGHAGEDPETMLEAHFGMLADPEMASWYHGGSGLSWDEYREALEWAIEAFPRNVELVDDARAVLAAGEGGSGPG